MAKGQRGFGLDALPDLEPFFRLNYEEWLKQNIEDRGLTRVELPLKDGLTICVFCSFLSGKAPRVLSAVASRRPGVACLGCVYVERPSNHRPPPLLLGYAFRIDNSPILKGKVGVQKWVLDTATDPPFARRPIRIIEPYSAYPVFREQLSFHQTTR